MPDYSKGCIYKIKHNDAYNDDNIYIGSTCNLIRRRNKHKQMCNSPDLQEYNRNVYKYIRDNGGWEQFVVLKISDYPCNSKSELNIEERRYLDLMKPKLNMIKPYVTEEEAKETIMKYIAEHKEEKREYLKEWYKKNSETLKKKAKDYHNNNKDLIKARRENMSEEQRNKINIRGKEKIKCECGCIVSKGHLARHRRTEKHIELIKKNLSTD